MKKNLMFALLAVVASGILMADEISLMGVEQWHPYWKGTAISAGEGGVLFFKDPKGCENKQIFPCDPDALYKISGQIRSNKKKGAMRLALKYRNEKKREISPASYMTVPASLTEVTETAAKGATLLKVKDISGWNQKVFGGCYIACNAGEDGSDIPNFRLISVKIVKTTRENEGWTLELAKPLPFELPQGMKIRQHLAAGANYLGNKFQNLTTEWEPFTVTVEGLFKGVDRKNTMFPPSTADFQIVMQILWTEPGQEVEVKDMKLTRE